MIKDLLTRFKRRLIQDSPLVLICRLSRFLIINLIYAKDRIYLLIKGVFKKQDYVTKKVLDSKMKLNLKEDEGISYELYKSGIREPFVTNAIQKEIQEGDIIIDIGANIGYYALLESRLVGEKGRVYAVEPVSQNMNNLKKNIELNGYKNIECYQIAIGDENKSDTIYVSEKSNWSSMIKGRTTQRTFVNKETVQVLTLDKFLEDKPFPDLVRMDVEGFEVNIIDGMSNILESDKPLKLFIELHPHIIGDQAIDILRKLKENGFKAKTVTFEPYANLLSEPQIIQKVTGALTSVTEATFGQFELDIDQLINSKLLREGQRLALEVILERK